MNHLLINIKGTLSIFLRLADLLIKLKTNMSSNIQRVWKKFLLESQEKLSILKSKTVFISLIIEVIDLMPNGTVRGRQV